ncbi:MAG: YHS domain-containing protein [Deltaproteobacteria bacterium]|nr:YHS domain-containing protein [Deltaproteobacteria bacterium]MBW2215900.1 YHS domain-containing protein [Deltaproteobacteria bacterium]
MVRFLIFALLAYLLYRILRGLIKQALRSGKGRSAETVDEMVQDPSCQTYIPLREAKRKVIGGQEYYFCSKECYEKFEKELKIREEV